VKVKETVSDEAREDRWGVRYTLKVRRFLVSAINVQTRPN